MKKALLLDVSAMMYRAFYAHMNFRTKGEHTGAIFGFTNTLLAAIDEFSPDYIGAAFDVKRKTLKRSEAYEGYKANRKPMPEELRDQIPRIEEVIDGFGIERFKVEGHEADDVLGTLAKKLSADGVEVYILTGDKDLSQVLDENVNIALLGKGEGNSRFKVLRTNEDVKEQLGVNPLDIPDLFGLIGDASDGIPGVRKVGVKKAVPMLELYGNLEGIYENLDKLSEIPGVGKGLIKNIEEDKELAFLSRELAIIKIDLELNYSLESLEVERNDGMLYDLFKTLEFRVLIRKLKLKENLTEVKTEVKSVSEPVKVKAPVKKMKKEEVASSQMGLFGMGSPIGRENTIEKKVEEVIEEKVVASVEETKIEKIVAEEISTEEIVVEKSVEVVEPVKVEKTKVLETEEVAPVVKSEGGMSNLKRMSLDELKKSLEELKTLIKKAEVNIDEKEFDEITALTNVIKDTKSGIKTVVEEYNVITTEEAMENIDEVCEVDETETIVVTEEELKEIAKVIDTKEELAKLIRAAKSQGKATIIYNGIGFAVSLKGVDTYIPLSHTYLGAKNLPVEELNNLFNTDVKFISYKFKDILKAGYNIKNIYLDTMIAYFLLTAYTKEDVDSLIYNETGDELPNYKDTFGKEEMKMIETDKMSEYLSERSKNVHDLAEELEERLVEDELMGIYKEIEMPLMPILAEMEMNGIAINPEYFSDFGTELTKRLDILQEEIFDISEEEFNLNSPKQLAEILFIRLNIDTFGVKKTKTGYSTGVEVLEMLRDRGEKMAGLILEYRKLSKLNSTYVVALPKLIDAKNRLHTTFNQTGTTTGRLSSSNPNLQNIPAKTKEGMRIRQGFIAREGWSLLAIDYSQIELRVLAEISRDENLVAAYKEGLDLHDLTARRLFELDEADDVTREQRTAAKIVNFSIIYGKTAFGLAKELSISRDEAKDYIEKYFAGYPKVKELEERIVAEAEANGYVKTLYGRKRNIDGITAKNKNLKSQAERMAVNTVIQGTAADILKKVMIEVYREVSGKEDITLNLQVHDELIFEIKDEKVEEYSKIIKKIMEESVVFESVKLEVNLASGKNWAEAK